MSPFTAETRSCVLCLLLGLEHRLLRLIAVMVGQHGRTRHEQQRTEQEGGTFHQAVGAATHYAAYCSAPPQLDPAPAVHP